MTNTKSLTNVVPESQTTRRFLWGLATLMFLVGLIGIFDRVVNSHDNTNYNNVVPWGLWVAFYVWFSGMSAGAYMVSTLGYVFNIERFEKIGRLAIFTSLVTLLMGLLAISMDLGHAMRAWHVLVYPNFQSPMAWMIWLYSIYMVIILVQMYLLFGRRADSAASEGKDMATVRTIARIGLPVTIIFSAGVGTLFATVGARPYWHSSVLPLLFVLSALLSGLALVVLLAYVFQGGVSRYGSTIVAFGRLLFWLLVLDVLIQISELVFTYRGGIASEMSAWDAVVGGPHSEVFWIVQVLIGMIIPLAILALPTRFNPRWVALSGLLIIAGVMGMRLNIIIPGLFVEQIPGVSDGFVSARTVVAYTPSVVEWLASIGIVGLGLLMFLTGDKLLPRDGEEESV